MRFAGSKNKKSIIPSSWFIRELKCKTFKLARMNILPTEMYPGFQIWGSSEPLFENSGGPLQHREIDGGNGLNKAIRQDFILICVCTSIIEINKNRLFFLLILCFGIHSWVTFLWMKHCICKPIFSVLVYLSRPSWKYAMCAYFLRLITNFVLDEVDARPLSPQVVESEELEEVS